MGRARPLGRPSAPGLLSDFLENTNTRVSALADVFSDQLERGRKRFEELHAKLGRSGQIKTFRGAQSFRELVQTDVDIVLIGSPPYFHPEHLEAALEAGKHVYLEKPVATDVRGSRKVLDLAAKAEGKVSVDVGFQIRRGPIFAEQTRRLHEGAVGEIVCAQGYYLAGDLPRRAKEGMSPEEARLSTERAGRPASPRHCWVSAPICGFSRTRLTPSRPPGARTRTTSGS